MFMYISNDGTIPILHFELTMNIYIAHYTQESVQNYLFTSPR